MEQLNDLAERSIVGRHFDDAYLAGQLLVLQRQLMALSPTFRGSPLGDRLEELTTMVDYVKLAVTYREREKA